MAQPAKTSKASFVKSAEEMNIERRATKRAVKPKLVANYITAKCPDGAYRKLLIITRETATWDVNGELAHDRAALHPLYAVHSDKLCAVTIKAEVILGFVLNGSFRPI